MGVAEEQMKKLVQRVKEQQTTTEATNPAIVAIAEAERAQQQLKAAKERQALLDKLKGNR